MVKTIEDGAVGGFADFDNRPRPRSALKSLPVIDLAPFVHDAPEAQRRRVARELRQVCVDIGFFYLAGHGIPQAQMHEVMEAGRRFFELPADEKMKVHQSRSPGRHGYVTTGGVNPEANPDKAADVRERFLMTREAMPGELQEGKAHAGAPVWPDAALVPQFEPCMRAYMRAMVPLAQKLARAFALSLELAEDHFDPMFRHLDGIMYLNYYPSLNAAELKRNQWSFSPHADYGAFTLLSQDSLGGLQVRNSEGEWIDVPPVEGAFVVNLGDLFALWTNDVYVSTLHRAKNVSGRARISVPFFVSPHGMTRIECLPTCAGPDNPPRHEPVLAGEYLRTLIAQQNRTGRPGVSVNTAERFKRN